MSSLLNEIQRRDFIKFCALSSIFSISNNCVFAHSIDRDVRLSIKPPKLDSDPIIIDLNIYDPNKRFPGWDGQAPSQETFASYPETRDIHIIGNQSEIWKGGGVIRGGRNIHWIGGSYNKGPYCRNFLGDIMLEGVLTVFEYSSYGQETGDAFTLVPDTRTFGKSKIYIANCRAENIDGFRDGHHGDCFQLPANYDVGGWCSMPEEVHIERFTGSTGCQGFFLAAQNFTKNKNHNITPKIITLKDVNLIQNRKKLLLRNGDQVGNVNLLYMMDLNNENRGMKTYRKVFRNFYLEPINIDDPGGCIFPNKIGINRYSGKNEYLPIFNKDGSALFDEIMETEGLIYFGKPPSGDFAKSSKAGIGGFNTPGMNYISPGYK